MARDKSKDDKPFNCDQEHELKYVSGLYTLQYMVYDFLRRKCFDKSIKYSTHDQVYKIIQQELGFSIPD